MVARLIILCTLVLISNPVPAQSANPQLQPGIAFDNPIPHIPGKTILGVLVNYLPHHHAPSAFITAYVVCGAVRSQAGDGPVRIYHAGEYFAEILAPIM